MCQTCVRRLFAGDALSVYHPAERHARHAAAFALPSQRFALYLPVYGVPQRYAAHALCPDALYHDEQPFQGDDGIQAVKRQPVCNFLRIKKRPEAALTSAKVCKNSNFHIRGPFAAISYESKKRPEAALTSAKVCKNSSFHIRGPFAAISYESKSGLRPLSLPPKFAKTQTFAYAAHLLQFPANQKRAFAALF